MTATSSDDVIEPDDARYGQVVSFPNATELRRRIPPLVAGLVVLGFAISVSVRARLGVSPWDVLHQGLAHVAHLSFGLVVVLVGLVVLGGPVTHAGLRRFHLPVREDAPEVLGE